MMNPHTPLMLAVMQGTPEELGFVLRAQCDAAEWVDRNDPNLGITPLMACSFREPDLGALAMAKLLVDAGACVETPDDGPGAFPVFMSAQNGKPMLTRFLARQCGARLDRSCTNTPTQPLGIAAQNGHFETVGEILAAAIARGPHVVEAIIDAPNIEGKSPCHIAVELARVEIAGALAAAGADLRRACPRHYSVFSETIDEMRDNFDPSPDHPVHYALDAALRSHARESTRRFRFCLCVKVGAFCT